MISVLKSKKVEFKMFFSLITIQEIARTIWYAFFVIYVLDSGWNIHDYSFIKSASLFMILLFEGPIGLLSDKIGRKKIYQISLVAFAFSGMVYIFLQSNKNLIFPAEILYAIGFAALSGTLKSSKINEVNDKDKGIIKEFLYDLKISQLFARTIGATIGALLFYFTQVNPFYLSAPLFLIALILSFFYQDYQPNKNNQKTNDLKFREMTKKMLKDKRFWLLLIIWHLIHLSIAISYNLWQPILKGSVENYKYILSFSFLFFNISGILGSWFAKKNPFKFNDQIKIYISIFIITIPLIIFYFIGYSWITILLFIIPSFGRAMLQPTLSFYLQKHIPNSIRGFSASLISSIGTIVGMVLLAIAGLLIKNNIEISLVFLIFNSIYLFMFIFLIRIYFKVKQ